MQPSVLFSPRHVKSPHFSGARGPPPRWASLTTASGLRCLFPLSDVETNGSGYQRDAPRVASFVGGGVIKAWFDPAFIKRLSG